MYEMAWYAFIGSSSETDIIVCTVKTFADSVVCSFSVFRLLCIYWSVVYICMCSMCCFSITNKYWWSLGTMSMCIFCIICETQPDICRKSHIFPHLTVYKLVLLDCWISCVSLVTLDIEACE